MTEWEMRANNYIYSFTEAYINEDDETKEQILESLSDIDLKILEVILLKAAGLE